jgi:uncharacterized membrane protein
MFFLYACLLLNTGLTNFDPPRPDFSANALFPLAVFVTFYLVRAAYAPDVERRWPMALMAVALATCLPLMNVAYHTPSPLSGRAMLIAFEISNFVWAAIMIWHARRAKRGHVALFFGVGLLYGAVLENGGIVLGFFHETNLTDTMVKPFVAPVATMIGWSVVLAMATFVTWQLRKRLPWLRKSAALSALAVGTFATLLDLQIDPIATAVGCWVWHETLPAWFHGVPLVNFIAWMCALVPFGYVMFRVQERRGLRDGAKWSPEALLELLRWSPAGLLCAALAFITVTLIVEGVTGPSWNLLNVFTARVLAAVF